MELTDELRMRQVIGMHDQEVRSKILGVTGGIAAGKSTVVEMFRELGARVVSADVLAREVVEPGSAVLEELVASFGRQILTGAGRLDRKALSDIIFFDPLARRKLNQIMHPAIAQLAQRRLHEEAARAPLVLYEAPLLFEAGAESRVDEVLVVTVSEEEQMHRLMVRDHLSKEEARARIESQMPQAQKVARADYVIDNSGDPNQTREAVRDLFAKLAGAEKTENLGKGASFPPGEGSSRE